MSIWNKILLGCIFVTALVLFVLGSRAMQAHRVWQKSYQDHVEAIAKADATVKELTGTLGADAKGLLATKRDLYELLVGRGRVWEDVRPIKVELLNQDRPMITVETTDLPAKSVVYAFEDKPLGDGGAYLGQFTVTQVGNGQVILEPSVRLSQTEFARVQASQNAQTMWRLYELMPTDDHKVLRELTQEQIEAAFPKPPAEDPEAAKYGSVNDYLYDGKIMLKEEAEKLGLHGKVVMVDEAGNPIREEAGERQGLYKEVEDGKGMFVRTLEDYETLFDEEHRIRSMTTDQIRIVQRDLQFLQGALTDYREQAQFRRKQIQDLEQELAKASHERDAVVDHESKLDGAIKSMKRVVEDLIARNEATIAEVARIQLLAAEIINRRTAEVVQASGR